MVIWSKDKEESMKVSEMLYNILVDIYIENNKEEEE